MMMMRMYVRSVISKLCKIAKKKRDIKCNGENLKLSIRAVAFGPDAGFISKTAVNRTERYAVGTPWLDPRRFHLAQM